MILIDFRDVNFRSFRDGTLVLHTNGCFDVLHVGHLDFLRAIGNYTRRPASVIVVSLNTDESVTRIKGGKRPIIPWKYRAEALSALPWVDCVVPLHEDEPSGNIRAIKPNVHFKGEEWAGKPMPETRVVQECGGIVSFLPRAYDVSTTSLIESYLDRIGKERT
jgi:rfaE bifunctional protein nucleotidyltransferase chain/domain